MRKPKRRKPRQKTNLPQQVSQVQIQSEHKTPIKTGMSLARWLFAALLAVATLIGGGVVFWPRVTVEAQGDLSNPATIQFVATNIGYVPLRRPAMGMFDCELAYGEEPSTPMRKCLTSSFPPEHLSETGYRWLNMDEKFVTRLEDWLAFTNKPPKLSRVNVLIRFSYYPWYLPFRGYRTFGFRSTKGSDGAFYLRPYDPET